MFLSRVSIDIDIVLFVYSKQLFFRLKIANNKNNIAFRVFIIRTS